MSHESKLRIYLFLLAAIIVVSCSAIFIRWAPDVSSPVLAFYRLIISGMILLLYYFIQLKVVLKSKIQWHWHYIIAGIFLAFHFITWIAALKLTTIANAIFLGTTHPFFAVLLSIIFLKESPRGKIIPVFILCLTGIFIMLQRDIGIESENLSGDTLAILSALFFAAYILIARLHRRNMQIIGYLGIVYTIAAVVCLLFVLIRNERMTGFSDQSWLMILLLALGPSLTGHSLLNWVSKHLEIYKVNLSMLLEPVLATIAGVFIFMEFPDLDFYLGAILIIIGLLLLLRLQRK